MNARKLGSPSAYPVVMASHLRLASLPPELAALVAEAERAHRWSDAADALAEWRHANPDEEHAELDVAHAHCLFYDATDIASNVEEACERALELLTRAVRLGFPSAALKSLRAKIRRVLKGEREVAAQIEALLSADPDSLDEDGLSSLAYRLAEKDDPRAPPLYLQLAELAAAELEAARAAAANPRTIANLEYRVRDHRERAAFALLRLGRWDEAEPILVEICAYPIQGHMTVLQAYARRVEHALTEGDHDRAMALFDEARTRGERTHQFPMFAQEQRILLSYLLEREDLERLRPVVERMEHRGRRKLTPEVEAELDRALALLAGR